MKGIFIELSKNELRTLIDESVERSISIREPKKPSEPFIKGIHELAKFLRISSARAQKLKNENVFPFWQNGRTLLFDPEKVRQAMMSEKSKKS